MKKFLVVLILLVVPSIVLGQGFVQILGADFHVVESGYHERTYDVSFHLRNQTNRHVVSTCYIPHLFNKRGEIFQHHSPGKARQVCSDLLVPPGQSKIISVRLSDFRGVATRVRIESVFVMLVD